MSMTRMMRTLMPALLAALPLSPALAHPGPTDAAGCHVDWSGGHLHCHAFELGFGEIAAGLAALSLIGLLAARALRRRRGG